MGVCVETWFHLIRKPGTAEAQTGRPPEEQPEKQNRDEDGRYKKENKEYNDEISMHRTGINRNDSPHGQTICLIEFTTATKYF